MRTFELYDLTASSDCAYDCGFTGSSEESQTEAEELKQSQSVGVCIVIGLSFRLCFRDSDNLVFTRS